MASSHFARAAALSALALALGQAALAQAPISYPSGTPATAAAPRSYAALAGGGSNSYGYGAQRAEGAGVIDLRRPTAPRRVDPDLANPPQDPPDLIGEPDGSEEDIAAATQGASAPLAQPAAETNAASQSRPEWLAAERVGPPYEVNGRWYAPTAEPSYAREGTASWYGPDFHGRQTASGETYDQAALTAAHPTLPLNSLVQVTNLENGREAILRVNDRGPFVADRLIDVSRGAAEALAFAANGTARVHVRYLGPAPRRIGEGAPLAAAPAPAPQTAAWAPPPAAQSAYVVQIGAFSSQANADAARDRAGSVGPVQVEPRGALYRVRVGFESRAQAEAARAQLADLGFPDAIVSAR